LAPAEHPSRTAKEKTHSDRDSLGRFKEGQPAEEVREVPAARGELE